MHGVGGRTVAKLRKHDLGVVSGLCPDIVIQERGTNDLTFLNQRYLFRSAAFVLKSDLIT